MKNTDILEDIKRYSGLGKLSIFVGAGVSMLSGFPSWNALVQDMADEIGYSYFKDKDGYACFSSEELLKIPQMYSDKKDETAYRNKVEISFENNCVPNEIHDLILSLYPNHILTTNYDTLIEETAIKFGRNFSVLNSNQVVSKAETTNYIIKVHGDFSANFVLKEQDYLDYENDYVLIDNVVKTIFATNLVIFVGYGLNDYNIKLILNWVKRVQSDSYIMPVFIHTGEKLSDIESLYQERRGLRVIDCNDYTTDADFMVKYRIVLKNILMFNNKHDLVDRRDKLLYINDKIAGIKNLNYIRREDFNNIFQGEYELNDGWSIVNKTTTYNAITDENKDLKTVSSTRLDFFEDFFEHEKEYRLVSDELYATVKRFIEKCEIKGVYSKHNFSWPNISIANPAFTSQYEVMSEFCHAEYTNLNDNYRKAYYLAQLGDYAASYNLYTDILKKTKEAGQWDIYFFSQINRHYLFSIIKQMINLTTGFYGAINFGKELKLFYEDFLKKLNYEMQYMQLETQFSELPHEFRSQYTTLSDFSKQNCYVNKYYELTKEKYEVEKSLQKDTVYFGTSKFDKVKLSMLETAKFIYDNMILFAGFDESKFYIKNAMVSWLEAYSKEVSKSKHGAFGMISNSRCKFTLTDIILISKNFKKEDIDYLANKIDLRNLPFDESSELEIYIKKQLESYNSMFGKTLTGGEIFLWKFYSEEIKMLLSIAPYFVTDNECKLDAVQFIINMPDGHFDISDRIRIINKWMGIAKVEGSSLMIENWLLEKSIPIVNNQIPPIGIDSAISDISMIAQLLSDIIEVDKCRTDAISGLIIDNRDNLVCVKPCLEYIYPVLNEEAKQIIEPIYTIENVFQLMQRGYSGHLPKNCDEFHIVESYLEEKVKQNKENKEHGIEKYTIPSAEEYIGEVAVYMFMRNFPSSITKKYRGICEEYDFLLCPSEFKTDTFQLEWLLTYSDNLCEKLKKCKTQEQIIIESVEKAFKENSLNQWQLKRLFSIYKMMIRG
ncbi:SIR2 family protein [Clostridium tyrobutyricum]|uniref:SIR2 family protein n=1 Tax=Clostridium tyrobutyricum TaxID=1519 RepID=UPI001C3909D7|nr:SIR2 family protein [Clostridium tyrobutyricum]MBV4432732.1 SIR2 family protein [Clostridium tyrobutyricum]